MTEQQHYPSHVLTTWRESFWQAARARQLETVDRPAQEARIARAQAEYERKLAEANAAKGLVDELNRALADLGKEHHKALTDAEGFHEQVELWCSKHGRDLPSEPEEPLASATAGAPDEVAAPPVKLDTTSSAGASRWPCPRCGGYLGWAGVHRDLVVHVDTGIKECPPAQVCMCGNPDACSCDPLTVPLPAVGRPVAGHATTETRPDTGNGAGGAPFQGGDGDA